MVPFKDEDCERFMEQEVKPWIEENVTDFAFDSYDGKKLQAYCAIPEKPKKALVFVHGFCEFFGKYHELFYDFYHAGYAVFFYGGEDSESLCAKFRTRMRFTSEILPSMSKT